MKTTIELAVGIGLLGGGAVIMPFLPAIGVISTMGSGACLLPQVANLVQDVTKEIVDIVNKRNI